MEFEWPRIVFAQSIEQSSDLGAIVLAAILGAIAGGLVTFFVEYYFRLREERRADLARDHALYLFINQITYDVTSIHSRLLELLGDKEWPLDLASKLPRMLGQASPVTNLDPALLATFKGPKSGGLVHELFELRNLRDLIVQLQAALNLQLEKLQELMVRHAESRQDLQVSSSISEDDPDFPIIDINRHAATDSAKQLIHMGHTFVERMVAFGQKYNEFKNQDNPRLNSNLVMDLNGLSELLQKT